MLHSLRAKTAREDGATLFILYLMMFIVMMGFFGLAVDTAMAVNAKSQSQATLDAAVVAGATQTQTNLNALDKEKSRKMFVGLYDQNRVSIAGVRCATSADMVKEGHGKLEGTSGCKWLVLNTSYPTVSSISVTIRECVPTFFLTPIQPENCFDLTSEGSTTTSLAN